MRDEIIIDDSGIVTTDHRWSISDYRLSLNIEIADKMKNRTKRLSISDKLVCNIILMNLLFCLDDNGLTNKRLYYSRDTSRSSAKSRYNRRGISVRKLCKAIDELENLGYLINYIAPRQVNKNKGETMSSFIKPTIEFFNKFYSIAEAQIERDAYFIGAYDHLLLRKNDLVGNKRKSVDVDFFDDANTDTISQQVAMLNEGNYNHCFKDETGTEFKNLYTRIFNNDFTQGGRYYRASILNMENKTSHSRLKITIDNEQVVEIDFSNMHLRMLAEESNTAHLVTGDAYVIPFDEGMAEYNRELVKYSVNTMINAKSRKSALAAIQSFMNKTNKEMHWQFENANHVIDNIYKAFPFLSFGFCNDSYGLRLMNIDSNIIQEITTQFYLFHKPILPVHDSCIVKREDEELLIAVMSDAWKTRFPNSVECKMKANKWENDIVSYECSVMY